MGSNGYPHGAGDTHHSTKGFISAQGPNNELPTPAVFVCVHVTKCEIPSIMDFGGCVRRNLDNGLSESS